MNLTPLPHVEPPRNLEERLKAAQQSLGTSWVLHPGYVPTPRHSARPGAYMPAREGYLNSIRAAAAEARAQRDSTRSH
jgi:hypothetical protein